MLITVSGSQGTGKSTLIKSLSSDFPVITRKTSRSILSEWGVSLSQVNNNRELTIKFQEEILNRKIDDDGEAMIDPSNVWISERSFADLFVYALVAIGKDNEYSDWLDEYYLRCEAAQGMYASVCYLKAGHFAPVNDGVRGANQHYSWMVDACMLEYTTRMSSDALVLIDTPSLQERRQIITNLIKEHL